MKDPLLAASKKKSRTIDRVTLPFRPRSASSPASDSDSPLRVTPMPQRKKAPMNTSFRNRTLSANSNGLDKMELTSKDFLIMMRARKCDIQNIKRLMRSKQRSADKIFEEAVALKDKGVLVHLLQEVRKPLSLRLAALVLPQLRYLLAHKNSRYANVALDVFNEASYLQDAIRLGLTSSAQSIGVDVAAEQRQMLCIKCKEALTEIYVTSELILGKLTEEQQILFNHILDKFLDLVS